MIGLLGFFRDSSPRAIKYLDKVQKKIDKYPKLKKYGVVSNFIFVMFFGAFITPGISIILGWSRVNSIIFMIAGICVITLVTGLGTLGIIELFFV
jgi:heme O synthase-like polyprenyltransferase